MSALRHARFPATTTTLATYDMFSARTSQCTVFDGTYNMISYFDSCSMFKIFLFSKIDKGKKMAVTNINS